jgi:hypothetical protein
MCLAAENVPIDAHCSTPAPFFLLSLLDDFDALDDFSVFPVLPGFLLFCFSAFLPSCYHAHKFAAGSRRTIASNGWDGKH